jgi:hypothetical protein
MPISGLVLTLEHGSVLHVAEKLAADPRLTLGTPESSWLPIAAETRTLSDGEDLVVELLRVPGVLHVDVVTVDFEDDPVLEAEDMA